MTQSQPVRRRSRQFETAVALLGMLVFVGPTRVRSEVVVEGSVASVRVQASRAPVSEILAALGTAFGVRYRASIALDQPITGTFSGPLGRVVARLLDGYDYVIKRSPDAIEIAVLGSAGVTPSSPANATASDGRSPIRKIRPSQQLAPTR